MFGSIGHNKSLLFRKFNFGLVLLLSSSRKAPIVARSFAFAPALSLRGCQISTLSSLRGGASFSKMTSTSLSNHKMSTTISFPKAGESSTAQTTLVIGTKSTLQNLVDTTLSELIGSQATAQAMLDSLEGSSDTARTFTPTQTQVILATIPDPTTLSRNNHPWSTHTITEWVGKRLGRSGTSRVVVCGSTVVEYAGALTAAVAKAFPVYSRKTTTKTNNDRSLELQFCDESGAPVELSEDASRAALAAVTGIQLAAQLVDMPPEELTTDAYAAECQRWAAVLEGVTYAEVVGEELHQQGYGGIWGVGQAATCPPRLITMEYIPPSSSPPDETIALVGKGIVYDTGGLSLKPKAGMCGMKADMGGSAGLLGGFVAAVRSGYSATKLTLVLCLAENAIGPTAFRNDDILTLYSGYVILVTITLFRMSIL